MSSYPSSCTIPSEFKAIDTKGRFINLSLDIINPDDSHELADFAKVMAHVFVSSEPTTVAANITEDEFYQEILHYLEYAKKDRLSLIIKDQDNNKIIGGIIGRDFALDEAEDPFVDLPNREKFQTVFLLLNDSKKRFIHLLRTQGYSLKPGLVYRGFFIGFYRKYINLLNEEGIALPLYAFRKFEEYLKNLGYKYLYGEATNPGSQNLFESSGWDISTIVIPYRDHATFRHIDFGKNAIEGVGNGLSGSFRKLDNDFSELKSKHLQEYQDAKETMLGFPHNLDFSYEKYGPFLNYHINNAGEPKNYSNYKIHTRQEESSVLNFYANTYKLPPSNAWGYITSGGMEANEVGLYLARCKFPKGMLYASSASHYSIRMIAHKLQIPFQEIETLPNGEINYAFFEESIKNASSIPIINLNIGTTMSGAIDDIEKIIFILGKHHTRDYYIHCDAALHGGFLPFLDNGPRISFEEPIDSVSISLHKFLGLPFPAAIFLSRQELLGNMPNNLSNTQYNGKKINTLTCSRNGHSALLAYARLINIGGQSGLRKMIKHSIDLSEYAENKLRQIGYPNVWKNEFSNIIVFKTPQRSICQKWQLAVNGDTSHIIILPHHNKTIIDKFINELEQSFLSNEAPFFQANLSQAA